MTWSNGTAPHSLSGRFTSPCFLQQGQDNALSEDGWVYMYFPSAADGKACKCSRSLCVFFRSLKQKEADWCNNDGMLLARAKRADLLSYDAWEVVVELGSRDDPQPVWKKNAWDEAIFVFTYPLMTGENGMCVLCVSMKRF